MHVWKLFITLTAVAFLSLAERGSLPVRAQQKIDVNGDAPAKAAAEGQSRSRPWPCFPGILSREPRVP